MLAAIGSALGGLAEQFEADELARALLKSKSEPLLCNALAARLGAQFTDPPGARVVREWGDGVQALGRLRIDLAVVRGDRPAALIEAKVARSSDLIVGADGRCPSGAVRDDIEKLRMAEVDGERYVLLLVAHSHRTANRKDDDVVTRGGASGRHGVVDDARIGEGFERFRKAVGDVAVCTRGRVRAGKANGVEVSLLYWLMEVR